MAISPEPDFNYANYTMPMDAHNQIWQNYVFPSDWQNPPPQAIYDLVVIGAGPAGLVIAAGAAGLDIGLKIALVEKNALGGDCLNVGCIPSKTLLHESVRVLNRNHQAKITAHDQAVMARVRQVRAEISVHDSAQRFKQMGIDVFLGEGAFQDSHTLKVTRVLHQTSTAVPEQNSLNQTQLLRFKKAVIATGTRPSLPDINGLDRVRYFTNETIFNLETLPEQLIIIGGGPIGCELAQAWQNLGTQVYLLQRGARLLPQEDPEAAAIISANLTAIGVKIHCQCQIDRLEPIVTPANPYGVMVHYRNSQGAPQELSASHLLIATGRIPNLESLELAAAGLRFTESANGTLNLWTNEYLQTNQKHIFAAGDVVLPQRFTHAADAAARLVIKNALFAPWGLGLGKWSDLVIPHAIYTQPEIAQVGHTTATATTAGLNFATITINLQDTDRGRTDGITEGFVKIHYQLKADQTPTDQILGATIVGDHASAMINEITCAMTHKLGLNDLAQVIHPYPSLGEAIRKAADTYRRQLLNPRTRRILRWLSWLS